MKTRNQIAKENKTSPMHLYSIIKKFVKQREMIGKRLLYT